MKRNKQNQNLFTEFGIGTQGFSSSRQKTASGGTKSSSKKSTSQKSRATSVRNSKIVFADVEETTSQLEKQFSDSVEDQQKQSALVDTDGIAQLQETASQALQKAETLETQVQELDTNVQSVSAQVQDLDANVQSVSTQMQNLDANVQSVSTQVQGLDKDVQDAKSSMQTLGQSVQTAGEQMQDLSKNVSSLQTQVQDLDTNMQSISTQVQDLDKDVQSISTQVQDLDASSQNFGDRLDAVESGLNTTNESVSSNAQQIQSCQEGLSGVEKDVLTLQTTTEQNAKDINQLKDTSSAHTDRLGAQETTNSQQDSKIDLLTKQLENSQSVIQTLQTSLDTLVNQTIPALQQQIEQGSGESEKWELIYDVDSDDTALNYGRPHGTLGLTSRDDYVFLQYMPDLRNFKKLKFKFNLYDQYLYHYCEFDTENAVDNEFCITYTDLVDATSITLFRYKILSYNYPIEGVDFELGKWVMYLRHTRKITLKHNQYPTVSTDMDHYSIKKIWAVRK